MQLKILNTSAQYRDTAHPDASIFTRKVTVRKLAANANTQTGGYKRTDVDAEYETTAYMEYRSNRDNTSDVESTDYEAELLVRIVASGMVEIEEGRWTVALNEPKGETEWMIVGVEWPLGWGRYPVLRIKRNTYAVVGE